MTDPAHTHAHAQDPPAPGEKPDEGILRRHFVAVATAHYDDPNYGPLPVDEEVEQLRAWLCDQTRLAERAFITPTHMADLAKDPDEDQIRAALKRPKPPWRSGDAAVVFLTGHGEVADGAHWTVLKESTAGELSSTALRTADLIGWLGDTKVEHLLLIVDTCFAGAIAEQTVRRDKPLPSTWLVLPSARKDQTALAGALTTAIGKAVDKLRGREGLKYGTDRYFCPADFLDTVKEFLGPGQDLDQIFRGRLREPHRCLPNPHFAAPASVPAQTARHELALPKQDVATHWGPRSRGVARGQDRGWLFTGRADLMRQLIAVLDGPAGTTLITGSAGCGKSAVLARLVTLTDPDFLDAYAVEVADIPAGLRPEPLSVDVAVLATGKWPHEILGQLFEALAIPRKAGPEGDAATLDQRITAWNTWLATRNTPVTIVLDALDEAHDPRAVTGLLARLTTGPNTGKVRLLVGVRSPGGPDDPFTTPENGHGRPLADDVEQALHAHRIRVDEDLWWNPDDVRDYVASVLHNTPGSPYTGPAHELADQVAVTLAKRVGRSFLVARITAASLATRTTAIDPSNPGWLAAVDDGVAGVFRDDLWQTFPEKDPHGFPLPHNAARREDAVVLLRAVAFTFGRGLPWGDIWPAVANAVADKPNRYGDRDIADLLDSRMNAYLVTDREDGVTVYRLFHDALRTTLREDWERLLDSRGTEASQ